MTAKIIAAKINRYYRRKMELLISLFTALFIMLLGGIVYSVAGIAWMGTAAVIAYFSIIVIAIMAAIFSAGKYQLKNEIKKHEISELLNYLAGFEGCYDKYIDMLYVIRQTVRAITNDRTYMNRSAADKDEQTLNAAWDRLDMYLHATEPKNMTRESLLEYVNEINCEILGRESIPSSYSAEQLQQVKLSTSKKYVRIRWNVWLELACSILLVALIAVKVIAILYGWDTEKLPLSLIYNTGSDFIALVFAYFSVKSEWKNR